jgi:hypothetical protein
MMRIIKRSGKQSYSNQLLERKVCEAENEKIKVADIVSTMYPRNILGEIVVALEKNLAGDSGGPGEEPGWWSKQILSTQAMVICGPGSYATSVHTDHRGPAFSHPQRHVVTGNTLPQSKRLLVYMSQLGKEVMASCTSWYVDGTFKATANTLFTEVHSISIRTRLLYAV